MTNTPGALAVRADQTEWTELQMAALEHMGIAKAPRGSQLLFLHECQRTGFDPFSDEIYLIPRWDPSTGKAKWTIQVGIKGFRSKSEEHPQFGGIGDAEWCGPDGQWVEVWVSDSPPVAARFTVHRKDQPRPIRAVAHYREYVQTNAQGKPTQRWQRAPADQLGKCAEAKARRTAFPRQLGGVYAPEELAHLDSPVAAPVVIDAEPSPQAEPDWDQLITDAGSREAIAKVWDLARGCRPNDVALLDRIAEAGQRITAKLATAVVEPAAEAAGEPREPRMKRLFGLLRDGLVSAADRPRRLRIVNKMLEIENSVRAGAVTSFADLSAEEVEVIIRCLERHQEAGDLTHTLAELGADEPSSE